MLAVVLVASSGCAGSALRPTKVAPGTNAPVATLAAGTRVRYRIAGPDGETRTDGVARASDDTLWLSSGRAVPVSCLARLEASYGPRASGWRLARSAAIGAALGGVLGALVKPDTTTQHRNYSRGETAVLGALVGFIVGNVTWVVVTPVERWTDVPLPHRNKPAR
jgi:hypothetical protein